jgi:hypothetical protein
MQTFVLILLASPSPMTDYREMLALSNPELARVDPVIRNLLVAKSIPALAQLEIPRYQQLVNKWAEAIRVWLLTAEQEFLKTPDDWKNDVNLFRLGLVHQYLEQVVGITYNEDQRNVTAIHYTNPSDLFLNGVLDTKQGTCGNMATLHFAIGWRLGWPVSLACVNSHLICRYDDGVVTHNIEATQSGYGGFKSDPDKYLMERYQLPQIAIACGSDLRALTARETLGVFMGLRARHMRDTGQYREADSDYLLARWLFPTSRRLYIDSMGSSVKQSVGMFQTGEFGSPQSLAHMLTTLYGAGPRLPRATTSNPSQGLPHGMPRRHG